MKATKMKKMKMKIFWMTHKAQSFWMTNKIPAKALAKTWPKIQSKVQSKTKKKKSQNQETPAGSQSVWKKWTLKRTTIYRFYKKGVCRSKKNCNFEHQKMCEVFKWNGLAKFNDRGCDGKCIKLHPLACRESPRKVVFSNSINKATNEGQKRRT